MNSNVNLYESLFNDDDDEDVGMLALNNMYDHLNFDAMSNYHSLIQYNQCFPKPSNTMLSILHFNIRSLNTNLVQIEALISALNHSPDIIAFSETWLNEENKSNYKIDGYNSTHVVRTDREHGGVAIYVKNIFEFELIEKFSFITTNIEICTISLTVNKNKYIVAAIYRPHDKTQNIKEFRNELAPILKSPLFKKSNVVILGDININLLQHGEHQQTNEYLNLMQTFNYVPLITRPTRFPEGEQHGDPSLLDHIFINFSSPIKPGILNYHITDQ